MEQYLYRTSPQAGTGVAISRHLRSKSSICCLTRVHSSTNGVRAHCSRITVKLSACLTWERIVWSKDRSNSVNESVPVSETFDHRFDKQVRVKARVQPSSISFCRYWLTLVRFSSFISNALITHLWTTNFFFSSSSLFRSPFPCFLRSDPVENDDCIRYLYQCGRFDAISTLLKSRFFPHRSVI